jgi:hypothetical protein
VSRDRQGRAGFRPARITHRAATDLAVRCTANDAGPSASWKSTAPLYRAVERAVPARSSASTRARASRTGASSPKTSWDSNDPRLKSRPRACRARVSREETTRNGWATIHLLDFQREARRSVDPAETTHFLSNRLLLARNFRTVRIHRVGHRKCCKGPCSGLRGKWQWLGRLP